MSKKNLVELTVTIPIPAHIKETLDALGWDYQRNLIAQLREAYIEIDKCIKYKKESADT